MSLYNLISGYNPLCVFLLPMAGVKPTEIPRFRDVFFAEREGKRFIQIYTRVGSANQNNGLGEEILYNHSGFHHFEDDEFDNTYGSYFFKCLQEWENDYDALFLNINLQEVSEKFLREVERFWKYSETIRDYIDKIRAKKSEVESKEEEE